MLNTLAKSASAPETPFGGYELFSPNSMGAIGIRVDARSAAKTKSAANSYSHTRAITVAAAMGLALTASAIQPTQANAASALTDRASNFASAAERRRQAIERIRARIEEFGNRPVNWDGMNGRAPSMEARSQALAFLEMMSAGFLPSQTYSPGDGEVLFQWDNGNRFIEVGFYGDETISWFIRNSDAESQFGDDRFDGTRSSVPDALVTALKI